MNVSRSVGVLASGLALAALLATDPFSAGRVAAESSRMEYERDLLSAVSLGMHSLVDDEFLYERAASLPRSVLNRARIHHIFVATEQGYVEDALERSMIGRTVGVPIEDFGLEGLAVVARASPVHCADAERTTSYWTWCQTTAGRRWICVVLSE